MWNNLRMWFRNFTHSLLSTIGFYPALIAISFLILSWASISFDFSETGIRFKSQLHWLSLKDAATARSIISSITAGIISLTVFSFTMVMIVLNQTASQMSSRLLDKLIGGRFQQVVLGTYIGTVLYALFLLSTIRDTDSGMRIPSLSTYLLIMLAITDLFIFIYFLHFITQSVKYSVIIKRISDETQLILNRVFALKDPPQLPIEFDGTYELLAESPGVYVGFNERILVKTCDKLNCVIFITHIPGTFILKGMPVALVNKSLSDEEKAELLTSLYLYDSETIEDNFLYGFKLLKEVAIKALSPGINDPGTAIQSMRSLFQMLSYILCHYNDPVILNKEKNIRIIKKNLAFEEVFKETILPIWDYGKNDRLMLNEFRHLILQLHTIKPSEAAANLLALVEDKLNEKSLG